MLGVPGVPGEMPPQQPIGGESDAKVVPAPITPNALTAGRPIAGAPEIAPVNGPATARALRAAVGRIGAAVAARDMAEASPPAETAADEASDASDDSAPAPGASEETGYVTPAEADLPPAIGGTPPAGPPGPPLPPTPGDQPPDEGESPGEPSEARATPDQMIDFYNAAGVVSTLPGTIRRVSTTEVNETLGNLDEPHINVKVSTELNTNPDRPSPSVERAYVRVEYVHTPEMIEADGSPRVSQAVEYVNGAVATGGDELEVLDRIDEVVRHVSPTTDPRRLEWVDAASNLALRKLPEPARFGRAEELMSQAGQYGFRPVSANRQTHIVRAGDNIITTTSVTGDDYLATQPPDMVRYEVRASLPTGETITYRYHNDDTDMMVSDVPDASQEFWTGRDAQTASLQEWMRVTPENRLRGANTPTAALAARFTAILRAAAEWKRTHPDS